ncbi:MAG: cob(I)yrinic acid a,c-diamide adenosyltransferase [Alphaproteobacteria bacterium CG_4_10_14_0_2_um_filter_63_37]|nr:MAG: cob(I)yrinic acid a,c-diamide adenosyltransferase [Proteobacteria bacterium CG1_02_64_396]PJA25532.1 MAG: cob(I)yrinic acid a,c-diamide adenosyltransferase [Alphaproteobacteria bacterium CG_4_10_14_0_2_um_filter_63_37]
MTLTSGRVLAITGPGKGKSSSAFGMVFRAAGWGMKVCVVQFIKGRWKTGEQQAAQRFDTIEWHALGDGFTWETRNPAHDQATARKAWRFCQEKSREGGFDLVVCDEILYAVEYGWITPEEIAAFVNQEKPAGQHLILTGGHKPLPEALLAVADTVTTLEKTQHGFDAGLKACKGIEF